jgi:hypothetical protein
MLFDSAFNNRIDTKKAFDYIPLLNTPRTISLLPPGLDVSRDPTRCYWTYQVNLLKEFYLIVFFYYQILQDLSVVSYSDTRE